MKTLTVGAMMKCNVCGEAWAEKCSHQPMGWHCTGCNGHNVSVLANPEIEWNIEEIKRKEMPTGEVQIWADVPKSKAIFIVNAVKDYDRLRAQNEELVKAINEAISKVDDAPFEWIRLNQDYLKPIVRPLKQALKSAEAK